MASYNLTIEDSSPLILYEPSGAWQDASADDLAGLAYSGNNLHSTTAQGATATINFNGTGISIFGGRRPSYGRYTMSIDGQTVVESTATIGEILVQQLLAAATGLPNGPHTAVLTCTGVGMDIDWVNLETRIGSAGSTTTSIVYDDAAPELNYAGAWETSDNPAYMNGTLHYSQAAGSAASLSFSGNAIAVYGTVSPDHANVQISIDGKTTMVNGGSTANAALHAQYHANDLDTSQHTLIITNPGQQDGTGPFIDLDSITVYSASVMGNSAGATEPTPSTISNQASSNQSSSGLSKGGMIGIATGVVLLILVLLGLVAFLVVRRKKRKDRAMEPKTPVDAELPLQGPNMRFTPVSPVQPMPTFSRLASRTSMHSIAPSYYGSSNNSRASFTSSTTPMVPTLGLPRTPRMPYRGVMIPDRGPERPSRPPSLDLPAS